MSPIDKWNSFANHAAPTIAFILFFAGIGLITSRKKLELSRQARVERGEMTTAEAIRNEQLVKAGSYVLTTCGALLVVMWLLDL